jgi:hypothetical protein
MKDGKSNAQPGGAIEFRAPDNWVYDQQKELSSICHFEFRTLEVLA